MKQHLLRNWLLLLIVLLGLFFRIYHYDTLFQYGHEQDLQSWIVKDILVDHHPRLIGQETSIIGVFIGPLYYYFLALFFALGNMNPLMSVVPMTIIAIATLVSVYYVFTKLFGKETGYIGSFIYAISLPITFLDRWAVPTQPTLLWCIWYLYVILTFVRGNLSTLPILIILMGLIWHVHIAFIPLLVLIPLTFLLSKRQSTEIIQLIKTKKTVLSIIIALLLIVPFVAFEARHGFQQTKSILTATHEGDTIVTGQYKSEVILRNIDRVLSNYLWEDAATSYRSVWIVPSTLILFCLLIVFLMKRRQLTKNEMVLLFAWILSVFLIHSFSKRPLSEYYFNNLIIISLLIISLFVTYLYKIDKLRNVVVVIGMFFLFNNASSLIKQPPLINEYVDKSNAVRFVAEDVRKNGYPCIGVTYIGNIGVRYGYRYLFWLNGVNQISPGSGVPVYNFVIPSTISPNEAVKEFGTIGVILPKNYSLDPSVCNKPERQLLPLNGFLD